MKFYRINVSGEKFFLSEKNILSDAPNMFTSRFADNLTQTTQRRKRYNNRMAVDRNPEIFRYIHRYLQGYDITHGGMPFRRSDLFACKLSELGNISSMNKQHIMEDAKFYGLKRLQRLLEDKWKEVEYLPLVDYGSDSDDGTMDMDVETSKQPVNLDLCETFSWADSMDLSL